MVNQQPGQNQPSGNPLLKWTKDHWLKGVGLFISSVLLPVATSVFVTSVNSPPNITDATAHEFLASYYAKIVKPNQRRTTYYNEGYSRNG
jgi:hypothetical protein